MPSSARTVTAHYAPDQTCYELTRTHTGQGDDPTAVPTSSSGCAAGSYQTGESIQLEATPSSGWAMAGWQGTSDDSTTSTTNSLDMPSGDHSVIANYVNMQDYGQRPRAFQWRTISGTSLELALDDSGVVTSPFPIEFGEGSFTTVHVSGHGNVSFTGPFGTHFSNEQLPVSLIGTLVAPFWDDLDPQGSSSGQNVFWEVIGIHPRRELVIEWRNLPHTFCSAGDNTVTFQVVLFENSSEVLFNYLDVSSGCSGNQGQTATVGIQTSTTSAAQQSYNLSALDDEMSFIWTLAQGFRIFVGEEAGLEQEGNPAESRRE